MSVAKSSSLAEFYQFIGKILDSNPVDPVSPEHAWTSWQSHRATLAAIQDGLSDVEAGRTSPLGDFDREFRQRHGLDDA